MVVGKKKYFQFEGQKSRTNASLIPLGAHKYYKWYWVIRDTIRKGLDNPCAWQPQDYLGWGQMRHVVSLGQNCAFFSESPVSSVIQHAANLLGAGPQALPQTYPVCNGLFDVCDCWVLHVCGAPLKGLVESLWVKGSIPALHLEAITKGSISKVCLMIYQLWRRIPLPVVMFKTEKEMSTVISTLWVMSS